MPEKREWEYKGRKDRACLWQLNKKKNINDSPERTCEKGITTSLLFTFFAFFFLYYPQRKMQTRCESFQWTKVH